ncbi:MAG: hypothetical protein ABFE02_11255 [Sulfuricella sp.]
MADANHSIDSTPSPPLSRADTPEAAIQSLASDYLGDPHSILCCALARAEAVIALLGNELVDDDRDQEDVLIHAVWDALGNIVIARNMVKRWDQVRKS